TARYVDPLAKMREAPPVTIDVSAASEARPWAEQAQGLVRDWFPHVCQLLATENYTQPRQLRLVFKPNINAPAYSAGGQITVNAKWIAQHPDDFGMMIHEMTHI